MCAESAGNLLEQYFKFYMRLVLLATIYFILEWCRRRKSLYLFDGVSLVLYATFLQKTGEHWRNFLVFINSKLLLKYDKTYKKGK